MVLKLSALFFIKKVAIYSFAWNYVHCASVKSGWEWGDFSKKFVQIQCIVYPLNLYFIYPNLPSHKLSSKVAFQCLFGHSGGLTHLPTKPPQLLIRMIFVMNSLKCNFHYTESTDIVTWQMMGIPHNIFGVPC